MGKKAKAHRAKVAKRNKKMSQERYSMQNTLNKMMEQMAKKQEEENLQVKVGNENIPFEVVAQPTSNTMKGFEFEGNVSFKENHPEILNTQEPEFDSAGFTIEDREIDVDTDMTGDHIKYEEVKNLYPANVEGSEEFNQANNE